MEYKIDTLKLSAPPEVRLGDRIYKIDNRLSVVRAIDKGIKEQPDKEIEVIIEAALGQTASDEIFALDPVVPVLKEIVLAIRAALMGVTLEEARSQFRKNG